ncbi:MAG TPA: SDR family oxidoreductase [Xanthobacteraceae bacterium]|nr:SDR family oxidoreductase [Xanthobacteraceae bacterium]
MSRRWLITGATGLLGDYLRDACASEGPVATTGGHGGDRPCDLRDHEAVRSLLADTAPDVVLHAAALTDIERCERAPAEAFAINRDAAANIAACLPPPAQMVFISTDQVYPDTPGPHGEEVTGPVNVYGQSKLAGEQAALAHPGALVLRTNFFGPARRAGRESLSDFVVRTLSSGQAVTLFSDILFSPLHMATLSGLLVELVRRRTTGLFNAGCRNGASKADFAFAIARHKKLQTGTAKIGHSESLPGRAPRPKDMRLDVRRLETVLGRRMPTLQEEIAKL